MENTIKTIYVNKNDLIVKRVNFYTRSGFGMKLPTEYMIKHNKRTKRIYCHTISNCGSLYILDRSQRIYVEID